jgi:CheY-like chemotaxis protein
LTGGVAHDFNSLLTLIIGYSDILRGRFDPGDSASASLEEIAKAGQRAANLTKQLLAFSRKQVLRLEVLDLNRIVSGIEEMLRRLIGEDIELTTRLNPTLRRTKTDKSQIEQVLVNLAVNARDAMPNGGKLTIETANIDLDENYAADQSTVQSGKYAMVAVSDTGCGMDKETLAHIFEPFFTTKELGKGTGLGLSTVYGIVKQSGGNVWVYSEPGKGTTFKICLPVIDEPHQDVEKKPQAAVETGGSETILLVEDEEGVRGLARRVLEAGGYTVLEAASPEQALELHSQNEDRIDLMITDVVMPAMSGRELAQLLEGRGRAMKVLYMSGYTDDTIVRHNILDAKIPFLPKPFTPETFARKVREVLDQQEP